MVIWREGGGRRMPSFQEPSCCESALHSALYGSDGLVSNDC